MRSNYYVLLYTLFLSCTPVLSQAQDDISMSVKLMNRIEELKRIQRDNLKKIDKLHLEIALLSEQKVGIDNEKEKEKLKKTIIEKTSEIIALNDKLSSFQFEYDKLKLSVDRLTEENTQWKQTTDELLASKRSLLDSVNATDKRIKNLQLLLSQRDYQRDTLKARILALEKRINDLVNYERVVKNVHIGFSVPRVLTGNFMYGKINRGGDFYQGASLGITTFFKGFEKDYASLISVSAVSRFILSKKYKMNFVYVSSYDKLEEKLRVFYQLEGGYSFNTSKSLGNFFNGGVLFMAGVGLIVNSSETLNPYFMLGLHYQQLNDKASRVIGTTNLPRLQFGFGAYF